MCLRVNFKVGNSILSPTEDKKYFFNSFIANLRGVFFLGVRNLKQSTKMGNKCNQLGIHKISLFSLIAMALVLTRAIVPCFHFS